MSLYVRQLAWLNTAPDAAKGQKQKPPIRLLRMKEDGIAVELPPNPTPYLTDWLMEIGPTASTGMGPAVLAWGEIEAWARQIGINLTTWEARTLRRLSRDFLDQMNKAKEPACPAPFTTRADNDEAVSKQFERMFRAMAANQKAQGAKSARKINK
ncbi:hypothetical protein HHL26_06725 [Sphingobium sp. TB-6]|uniref:hypothetical protein n=1 Tax=Sphingobium sp. TB-6 TaxID=2728850 RepID=UPI00146B5FFF|nr:hypothetical protein [Sphingobium sp. TB-6]NML88760.1 hypothetical protein [Sphingobium sp. TB-6]